MSTDPRTPATDPDFAHLLDLLAMLPGPSEDRAFWAGVWPRNGKDPADEPKTADVQYVFEKMAHIWLVLKEPTANRVAYLTRYLLYFFGPASPRLWELLNRVVRGMEVDDGTGEGGNIIGRLWAEDMTRTAWTLYVRYSGDDRWKAKWQFRRDWLEWLPDAGDDS